MGNGPRWRARRRQDVPLPDGRSAARAQRRCRSPRTRRWRTRGRSHRGWSSTPALFTFFVVEYLFFEEVHLYTYDFFAERVGFKLGWGCLAFYPYFYCVGLWSVARRPDPHAPVLLLVVAARALLRRLVALARRQPPEVPLQDAAHGEAPRGARSAGHLRRGAAAPVQRLLEAVAAHQLPRARSRWPSGSTLALGWPLDPWPWLYPLYYLALLLPRQADDDRRCAKKYGALWAEYCRRVPARIIPGIY